MHADERRKSQVGQELYQEVIPLNIFQSIWRTCSTNKQEYEASCQARTKELINELFDDLKQFQFDESITRTSVYLDNEKAKITNKESERYMILCIINSLVKSFKVYKKEENLSEATYIRMFSQLLDDLLMNDTSITFYNGETVSRSTKRMKTIMEDESEYGRRIDLIVKSKEAEEQYDLCSNEFKKANVSIDALTHQQSKNLRINACISNDINLLFGNTNTRINYFDFSEHSAAGRQ
ncbi:hypothetical protein G6F42_023131 [Rhizopus arrhizus]|nr:hypothetical protein G6F42_023131 [Rhizopus arrhizus]